VEAGIEGVVVCTAGRPAVSVMLLPSTIRSPLAAAGAARAADAELAAVACYN
jgi:hypothetical protein